MGFLSPDGRRGIFNHEERNEVKINMEGKKKRYSISEGNS